MQKKVPTRIVFFDFAVAAGGSIVVLLNTLKSLDREKYAPIVVTALPKARAQEIFGHLSLPIITHRHPVSYVARFVFLEKPIFHTALRRRLASYLFTLYAAAANSIPFLLLLLRIKNLKPALIHTHNGIDSMIIGRLLAVPSVLHLHGPFGADSRFEAAVAKMAKLCICVSQGIADMLASKGVPAERLLVLPNPSPVPLLDATAVAKYRATYVGATNSRAANAVLVAHVGRLVAWKGQLEFLRAFALIAKRTPTLKALVVGDDAEGLNQHYVSELQRFVVDNDLSERVIFTGRIEDIHNLVAAVDIVVHSSTEPEPFGLVVTEAMALGKPVIAASYGATAEIVDQGVNGLLVDPADADALAQAISTLEQDAQLRARFGAAGLQKAEREYSLSRYKEALEKIYDRLIAG